MSISTRPFKIKNLTLSPVNTIKDKDDNKQILNLDNNLLLNKHFPIKEISELMKGSYTNRNKLNIFNSPRNQIIKHFKDSLSKTNDDNFLFKSKQINNLGKTRSSNKIITSNKFEHKDINLNEIKTISLVNTQNFSLNRKKNENDTNNKFEKNHSINFTGIDKDFLRIHKKQNQLSLDRFLTNNSLINNKINYELQYNRHHTSEKVMNTEIHIFNSPEKIDIYNKNTFENNHNYNIDELIEKENNNFIMETNNFNISNSNKLMTFSLKSNTNIKSQELKESKAESGKIDIVISKILEKPKKISNKNSMDANIHINKNERISFLTNQKIRKNNSSLMSNYYSNYNTNLLVKKNSTLNKNTNLSNNTLKKKISISKDISYGNSKNIISEKIVKIDKNISNKYFATNNNNNFNGIKTQKDSNIRESDKIISTERLSIKKKTVLDKNISSTKFYNEKKIVSNGISNPFNIKSYRENKISDIKKYKGVHFNSLSIANITSPKKNINFSNNNDSIISEKDIYKTENNKLSKIKTEKSIISVSQDLTIINKKTKDFFNINSNEKIELKNSNDSKTMKKKEIHNYDKIYSKNEIKKKSLNSFDNNSLQLKKKNNSILKKELSNLNKSKDFNQHLNNEYNLFLKDKNSRNTFNENGLNKNIKNFQENQSNENSVKDDNEFFNKNDKIFINDFTSFNSNIKFKDGDNEDNYGSIKSDNLCNIHQLPKILKNINDQIYYNLDQIGNLYQKNYQSDLNKDWNSENYKSLENGITKENLKKSNNINFEQGKSNLINLNTYSLLKKQIDKNNLKNNDFLMQFDLKQELYISPDSNIINRNKTHEFIENNSDLINSKESALQSNIDLNIDVDQINSNNSSVNNKKDKNSKFIKINSNNNQIGIVTDNFLTNYRKINQINNKDFTNLEEDIIKHNFNSNIENNDLSENALSKNLQNFETQNIVKGNKPKNNNIIDNLIPSPIPRKKEKPIFMDIINDLKINSEKFSPLRRKEECQNQLIVDKIQSKNKLCNNEDYENNFDIIMKHNIPIEEREIIESKSKTQQSNKKSICGSNKINKINKFDIRENSPSNIKKKILKINKDGTKDHNCEILIKNIKLENTREFVNSDQEKNLNKSRKNSINELTNNFTLNFNNCENIDFHNPANHINIAQNIQKNSKENLLSDMKLSKTNILNMPFKKDILETYNNNNENIDNIKIKEEFSTINNIYDEIMNTSKYKYNTIEKRENELFRNDKNEFDNVNKNQNYLKEKINCQRENISFKKINYHIDTSNNYRNKIIDRNIINKNALNNFESSKKINNNNSENGNNFNTNANKEKNSTLSTLFNENDVDSNTKNKNNLINHQNYKYQNGRKNKNSLNNFAEDHKNKFNNLTDISNKINFTVSSIITENPNLENNQEYKSKDDNNKNNEEESPYINESENTQIKEFSNNINYHNLEVSRKIKNEDNESFSSKGINSNLDLKDLDEKMINYEIPQRNESKIFKNKNFFINNLKHEKVIEASRDRVVKKVSINKNENFLNKNSNQKSDKQIYELKNQKNSTSQKTEIKNIMNDDILTINDSAEGYTINKNENSSFNKINHFEIKNRIRKSVISAEKNINSCNNLSIKNTNFTKSKNDEIRNNHINNILGNLIISKKFSTDAFSEQISSNKNPLECIINRNNKNNQRNFSKKKKKNNFIKDDSILTEIKTDETPSINNLKAYVCKNNNNEKITQIVNSNNIIDCRDLDESASLINYNYNPNNIDANNSNMMSFYESGRKSIFQGQLVKKLNFDLVLKIHNFSNTNLIKFKFINRNNYLNPEKNTNKEIYKNDILNKKNLQNLINKDELLNDQDISQNCSLNMNNYSHSEVKEKNDVNNSFSNNDNHQYKTPDTNFNNQKNTDKLIRKNENFLSDFYTDLNLKEIHEFKENLKIINNNIIRFNTDKSQSSKKTSNNQDSNNLNLQKKNIKYNKGKKNLLSNSFWNILSFFNGREICNLYYSFRRMRLLIIDCLMIEVNRKILNKFKLNCGSFLELLSKKLTFKKNKSKLFLIFSIP